MCTYTENIHPFHPDRTVIEELRTTLVTVGIAEVLAFMEPITDHDGGFSVPIHTRCPYNPATGGTCLDASLRIIFPDRQPSIGCQFRQHAARSSNKSSF